MFWHNEFWTKNIEDKIFETRQRSTFLSILNIICRQVNTVIWRAEFSIRGSGYDYKTYSVRVIINNGDNNYAICYVLINRVCKGGVSNISWTCLYLQSGFY